MDRWLSPQDRITLLELARNTLVAHFADRPLPDLAEVGGAMAEHRGAFVTLTIDDQLRGCIGHVEGIQPLWKTVRDNAISAAVRDPRFPPLTAAELPLVAIELSILSPLERMDNPLEVQVGVNGLLVECGVRRGLLLPQVAARYGWDAATFLDQTCRKAGLEPGCWQSPQVTVYGFTAEHFSEAELVGDVE